MSASHLSIGLDVGGSKSVLVAEGDDTSSPIKRYGPAANPQRAGLESAARTLTDLVQRAVQPFPTPEVISLCAGVAGAGRDEEQSALEERLRRALQAAAGTVQVQVMHDANIALEAAFGTKSGVIVIVGTGSVGVARMHDGTLRRVGGWGYLLGDPGSGYAIGRAGLRAAARAFEGGPATALRAKVCDHFDIHSRDGFIQTAYDEAFLVQDAAPLVVAAAADGDTVAANILEAEVDELAQQVAWLVEECEALRPRLSFLGGLAKNPHYAQRLRAALRHRMEEWTIERLQAPPVQGALRVARRMHPASAPGAE